MRHFSNVFYVDSKDAGRQILNHAADLSLRLFPSWWACERAVSANTSPKRKRVIWDADTRLRFGLVFSGHTRLRFGLVFLARVRVLQCPPHPPQFRQPSMKPIR